MCTAVVQDNEFGQQSLRSFLTWLGRVSPEVQCSAASTQEPYTEFVAYTVATDPETLGLLRQRVQVGWLKEPMIPWREQVNETRFVIRTVSSATWFRKQVMMA